MINFQLWESTPFSCIEVQEGEDTPYFELWYDGRLEGRYTTEVEAAYAAGARLYEFGICF